MQLIKAFIISFYKHWGQKDKANKFYFFHIWAVMRQVDTYDEKIVALLHDIVEDTDMTLHALKHLGFKAQIIGAVDVITKKKGQSYFDYLKKIKKNELATAVKIADLKHNSNLTRLKQITIKDIKRQHKYNEALQFLMCD